MGRAVEILRKNTLERNELLAERAEAAERLEIQVEERTAELSKSLGELRALGDVSHAVNSTIDLETVLSTIIAKATQLSSTEAGTIFVFDETSQQFQFRASYGMDEALISAVKDRPIHLGETMLSRAVLQRTPIQLADAKVDESSLVLDVIQRAGFRAVLTVPLLGVDRIVGALVVRRKAPGEFPPSTINLMQSFASQSALAIQNARLFQEIEDKSRAARTGEPAQVPVPGQHEPRAADAAQCHPRLYRAHAGRPVRRAPGKDDGSAGQSAEERQAPAWPDQ